MAAEQWQAGLRPPHGPTIRSHVPVPAQRECLSVPTLTSFRATHTVYRATILKTCSSSRRRVSTCARVRTSEKPAARSRSRSATRPHLLAGGLGGQ